MHGETEETTTLTHTVIDPKRAEEQSQAHIHFLECMDQVNRVIQKSDDVEQMLWKVLEKVFSIFGCDRIWLLNPCDPETPTYRIPVEVTRPEYPGAHDLNLDIPMKPGGDKFCAAALATSGAVQYNSSSDQPIFSELTEQFGVLSQMSVAIYPKIGKPWMLGMHQCSCERVWTEAEQRLFEEIGRRIGDGLNTLLLLRDLRESERRYRELADLLPQAVCDLDTKGDITFGNRHGFALFGYSPDDLTKGFNVAQIIAPQDRGRMQAIIHDRMSGIEGKGSECLGLRQDGSSFPALVYASPIERNDEIIGIRCLLIDITDRKQVEEELKQHRDRLEELVEERTIALRQSEQRLALAMDAANDGLWDFNPQTGETYFSPRWYSILGYKPDEMPPSYQTFTDLIHPEDRAETLAYIERHIASGEPFSCEFRMRQKNGGYLWVLDRGQTMEWDEQGRPLRLIGMHTDISARKQAEEALQATHRQLQDIIEFLPDATFVIDRDKKVVAWNRATEEMTGVSKVDILGRDDYGLPFYGTPRSMLIDLLVNPDQEIEAQYDLVIREGRTIYAERFVPLLRQGKGAYLWAKASPLLDQKGNRVGAIESLRDITERKRAEEDIKDANRELDAFVYTVSHDLRSPLTPIIGYADFLRENYSDRLDDQALDCLTEISTSGGKMVALMEDLLTLAKVGQIERPAKPVDVNQVVQGVAKEWGSRILDAGLTMNWKSLPALQVTKTLLAQVFDNLIGNAVRYAGREGGPIEIGGERSGQVVRFFVRDHGPGIPAEERSRIFEVFFRGTMGKMVQGTGVGLAIVQKIARLYGGRVWVEETHGGGCTFWVEMEDVTQT
jgi:PAS domain S-box-containing protein